MKRLLLHILLFLLPIFVVAICFEVILRAMPTSNFKPKRDYLDKNAGEIEILFIGSSHTMCSFNPDWFTHISYNLGISNQNMKWNLELYRKYLDKLQRLKCLVIDYDSISLFYNSPERKYEIFKKQPTNFLFDFEFTSVGTDTFQRMYNYLLKGDVETLYDTNGSRSSTRVITEKLLGSEVIQKTAEKSFNADLLDGKTLKTIAENTQAMYTLAEFTRDRDIQLIFVSTPLRIELVESLNKDTLDLLKNTINRFLNQYPEVIYLDWTTDPEITMNDFTNVDHLNVYGAEKLSKKLNDFINSLDIEWDCECESVQYRDFTFSPSPADNTP